MTEIDEDDLRMNLEEISDFIVAAGGRENLVISEDETNRLGSASWVLVRAKDSILEMEFEVLQNSRKYLVYVGAGDDGETGLETADPNPPQPEPTPSSTA
ncbi:MAG TPA: hypothetical protein PKE40_02765 [Arachnia sp.]|nr:hypothetical protein [Arachnia sp.]HMT85253.1 hypothetical protein [Arachnia sp.]